MMLLSLNLKSHKHLGSQSINLNNWTEGMNFIRWQRLSVTINLFRSELIEMVVNGDLDSHLQLTKNAASF